MKHPIFLAVVLILQSVSAWAVPPALAPRLATPWTEGVSAEAPWPEYPRPQLVREDWTNLNGVWNYAVRPSGQAQPDAWDGEIVVPFCIESALSRVGKAVKPDEALWYRRSFVAPASAGNGRRTLLHFGAVDWEATVWLNGKRLGDHRGGYDPFSFDVTEALNEGDNELVVRVVDPTDSSTQPRGKQVLEPKGIWYTAVTGIWQTVWLETTPAAYVRNLRITPNVDESSVTITVESSQPGPVEVAVVDADEKEIVKRQSAAGRPLTLQLPDPNLWSPETPYLYGLKVALNPGEDTRDRVTSYFGLREIKLGSDAEGVTRILLNGKPLFQFGLLDQGWWPDGLYTAPCDEALKYDVEITRKLGFNMARKHVKVEPQRWYWWCDKLGVLVWQDMPSGDRYIGARDPDVNRSAESAQQFEQEWAAIIAAFANHPSIVMWVPFNEGWGQYDTARIVDFTRQQDPTRLVNSASGWTDRNVGDVHDIHHYPDPKAPRPEPQRAAVLGEFGGLGLPIAGHTWLAEGNWGYRSFKTQEELKAAYLGLIDKLRPLVAEGLSAAVYTQTSDVEIEVNGLMTYDRSVLKLDEEAIAEANRSVWSGEKAPKEAAKR